MTDDRPTINRDALRSMTEPSINGNSTPEQYAILDLLAALDTETRRADAALGDLRLAIEQGDCYLAASKAASRERWDAVAERDSLGERIAAVRALHYASTEGWCWECSVDAEHWDYPCATVCALDEGAET